MISTLRQQTCTGLGQRRRSTFAEKESGSIQHTDSQQVEARAPVHLPFQSFEPVDVAFGLTVAPGQFQGGSYGCQVRLQPWANPCRSRGQELAVASASHGSRASGCRFCIISMNRTASFLAVASAGQTANSFSIIADSTTESSAALRVSNQATRRPDGRRMLHAGETPPAANIKPLLVKVRNRFVA